MCHDFDYEMLKRAYLEQVARRNREKAESEKKPAPSVTPASKPAETAPGVRDKEPVPA